MNSQTSRNVSRRTVLQGLGASLTLPWMESLAHATGVTSSDDSAAPTGPPRRWATILFANGVSERNWWAKGGGAEMELSPTLEPLAPFKKEITVLNNLYYFGNTSGPHWPLFTNFLSGTELQQTTIPNAAESADMLAARLVGNKTPLASLVLGTDPARDGLRLGVPAIYYSTVSWSSKRTPIAPEIYPRQVFDRLFDTSRLLRDRSVLDAVLEQSHSLRRSLAHRDRTKLDQYMHHVREMEQRIDRAAVDGRLEGWQPSIQEPSMDRPAAELPQDVTEHMRMMLDLLVLALQMDKTRIASYLMNGDVSGMKFDFLDGVGGMPMHAISHHSNEEDHLQQYERVNRFHCEQLAYLLKKMKAVDEGNGTTLLDNSMILFGSNMMDGNVHDGRKLPLILAGGGGGSLSPGRVLSYESDEDRKVSNLYLAILQRMGAPVESFGDSVRPLKGLTV
jgi:hypothetical protein